ncbi:uncharacterized protein SPPG_00417 [Spizellomyces punctatus DAOM BR117]|uniref:Uncharacterized protein n=1 Tax=Spizellomyces punctatus (strain DAOM BR117) TaxID=645134 RepID=A0A0L0HUC6_SPIPD|nr:uncharacterized protein SPPG_00417 [Spizellomyces punctatus DAOM BR117]KND04708.1 hypothetical protein SPPG_00417 [Spizellomyces punctatus DAOM BR117]|eukprot:XP_016612747.1 hypothetical protein SPPG_00417 [Spizellomyces punctatus DAOM BR117]
MNLRFESDAWAPAPVPVGEDKVWREVEQEKEWSERAKDMSVPALSGLRRTSFGGLAPAFLQRKDSSLENGVNPWKSFLTAASSTSPVSMIPHDLFAVGQGAAAVPAEVVSAFARQFSEAETSGDESSVIEHSDGSETGSVNRSRSRSPTKPRRRSSIVSLRSLPRVPELSTERPISPLTLEDNSVHSSTSTLVEATPTSNSDTLKVPSVFESTDDTADSDAEELSTESSITFYQGFRALHPKLATPSNPSSPRSVGLRLGQSTELDLPRSPNPSYRAPPSAKHFPEKARIHAASINNIARLFSELLNERDSVLHESERLEGQRTAISDELRQIEDLLTELGRRKHELSGKLKRVVEKEDKVNQMLDDLDARISSIGDETMSFERTIRTLKGRSASIAADVETDDEAPEIQPNTCYKTLYGHSDSVECLDFDMPYGTLVTGSADRSVRVWDLSSHRCAALLQGHTGWVRAVQVKDQVLMSGSGDHSIRQWNLSNLPPLPAAPPGNLASSPFYTPEADEVCVHMFRGHTGGVGCLMFDDQWLVSGSVDKTVRQWDRETGNEVAVLRSEKWVDGNHMDKVDRLLIGDFPSMDDRSGLEEAEDGKGIISKRGFKLYNVGGHVGALQFWHHALAAGYGDGVVRLWDLRTGKCHRELAGHLAAVTTLKFDQAHVISGSVDKTIKVWDLRTGEAVDEVRFDGCVNDLHHDMFRIVVAAGSKDVQIYNRTTSVIKSLEGHSKPVRSLRHMDDTLISGGMDTTVRIWRI